MKSVAISLLVIALSLTSTVHGNLQALESQLQVANGLSVDNEFLRLQARENFASHQAQVLGYNQGKHPINKREPSVNKRKWKPICKDVPVIKKVLNQVCVGKCKVACAAKCLKNPAQLKICVAGCDPQCMENVTVIERVCEPVNDSERSCSRNSEISNSKSGHPLPIEWEDSESCSKSKSGHQLPIKWKECRSCKRCRYPRRCEETSSYKRMRHPRPIRWEGSRRCSCSCSASESSCSVKPSESSCSVKASETSSSSSSMSNGKGSASASGSASSNGEVTSTSTASGMSIHFIQGPLVMTGGNSSSNSSSSSGPMQIKWDKSSNCSSDHH